jgi:methionyl aminopeptidase
MIAKTQQEIDGLREAGHRMAQVVKEVLAAVGPGVSSMELERVAREATARVGGRASYLGYKNPGHKAYPAALCVSINDQIAHSPPIPEKILKEGDVVSIDFGLEYKGFFMDTAHTVVVGQGGAAAKNLLRGTQEALGAGMAAARAGGRVGDISAAVEATAKKFKLGIVKDLRGHGVGADVHEEPHVPNFGRAGTGEELVEGLVIAIEPIFAEKSGAMADDADGFTYKTCDHSRAAHFEHTVLITKDGAEILTALN